MMTPFVEAELVEARNRSCRVPGGRGGDPNVLGVAWEQGVHDRI